VAKPPSKALPQAENFPGSRLIRELLEGFEGIEEVAVEEAELDPADGSIVPAAISLGITTDALGVHMLEFIAWAVSDMESAGASVHLHLDSQPPWLNDPGHSLVVSIYVNPRSDDCSVAEGMEEIQEEIEEMAAFFKETYNEYWPACRPKD
jgi:translation elongation factor EF-1beta